MISDNPKMRSIYIQTIHTLKEGQDPNDIDWQKDGDLGLKSMKALMLGMAKYRIKSTAKTSHIIAFKVTYLDSISL